MHVIAFHAHCPDGWCAAYIASKRYPEAELLGLDHGLSEDNIAALISSFSGCDVLMVDFSFRTREQNDQAAFVAKSFQIYDHHKTAQAILEGAPYAVFDMQRSGAGLAWDYLFGKDSGPKTMYREHSQGEWTDVYGVEGEFPRPWYVNYVEDRDLWNWKLENSKAICAFLGTLEFTKEAWDKLDGIPSRFAYDLGAGALAHINHYVREAVKQAQTGVLQGYQTAVLNVPYLNCSEVGNELAKTHEVSLTWFERGDGIIQFSLRSIGDIDVSSIAKIFGGGGHRNAAGFQKSVAEGRGLVDYILGRGAMQNFIEKRSPSGCA